MANNRPESVTRTQQRFSPIESMFISLLQYLNSPLSFIYSICSKVINNTRNLIFNISTPKFCSQLPFFAINAVYSWIEKPLGFNY